MVDLLSVPSPARKKSRPSGRLFFSVAALGQFSIPHSPVGDLLTEVVAELTVRVGAEVLGFPSWDLHDELAQHRSISLSVHDGPQEAVRLSHVLFETVDRGDRQHLGVGRAGGLDLTGGEVQVALLRVTQGRTCPLAVPASSRAVEPVFLV